MKIAMIGVGGIAGNYRQSLKRLNQPIAAVCDVNAERARQVAAEEGAHPYTDHRELLEREQPDAVFIAIPPFAHKAEVADSALAGANVFVAKPIALNVAAALPIAEIVVKSGVINQVGYMARYADITQRAAEILGDRLIGMLLGRFMCRMGASHPWWGQRAMSGGQMLEQTTHVFDLARLFGGEVTQVHALGRPALAADNGQPVADFEDCTTCNLQFAGRATGNISSTYSARVPDGFALEIVGADLYLRLSYDLKLSGVVDGQPVAYEGQEAGYFRQVEQFLEAVRTQDQHQVRSSYIDALKTLAVTDAANRSLHTGHLEHVEQTPG
jgi:myo-inositol 2-dehydrogenase / D-chiro-inositol 1-dehydrogenase